MELPKDPRLSYVSRAEEVEAPPERVFAVLEDPALLADLLPPSFEVELVSGPWMIREGVGIHWRMTLRGVGFDWRVEVCDYVRGESLVHRLVEGPLEHFEHRQLVQRTQTGSRLVDLVSFRAPFGWLGRLFGRLALRSEIEAALSHRARRLREMLGGSS